MRVRLFSSLGLVVLALVACAEASGDDLENGQNVTPGVGGGGSAGSSGGGKGGSSGTSSGGASGGGAAGAGGAGASGSSGQAGGGQAGTGGAGAGGAGSGGAGGAGAGGAGASGSSGQAGGGQAGASGGGAGGAGAGAGGAGAGGAGAGGAGSGGGGAGGAGAGGAGGDAGAAGTAGTAGASGTGGAGAGAGGTGGAGAGGDAGAGGAGAAGSAGTGGAATGPSLVVVGAQPGADAFAAAYADGGAWSTGSVTLKIVGRPGLGVDGPGARLVARNGASSNQLHQAVWSPAGFAAATPLPGAPGGVDGPFVASSSSAMWATLLGNDNKHYVTKASAAGAFGLVSPLGADVPQAFGDSAASIATAGADTWAIYSGQNDGLYALHHDGSAWSGSEAVPGAGSRKAITPQIAMAGTTPTVVFVRGGGTADNAVCVTQRGSSTWSAPVAIPTALSSRTPGVVALANGDLVVAWHGYNDDGIYAARRSSGTWSSVIVLETNVGGAAGAPVVVTGLPGADAEIVYGKGGKLRHARLTGTTASPVDVGGTSVVDVAAVVVP